MNDICNGYIEKKSFVSKKKKKKKRKEKKANIFVWNKKKSSFKIYYVVLTQKLNNVVPSHHPHLVILVLPLPQVRAVQFPDVPDDKLLEEQFYQNSSDQPVKYCQS